MALSIPADLSAPMYDGFQSYPRAPATRQFLKLARSGARWSPTWPRWLTRYATKRRVTIDAPEHFVLLSAGFFGIDQPWRIFVAARTIERLRRHPPYRPRVWGIEGPPRRWSAPESALRTTHYGSPAGPMPTPDAPPPPAAPAPASTSRPSRPGGFGLLHG